MASDHVEAVIDINVPTDVETLMPESERVEADVQELRPTARAVYQRKWRANSEHREAERKKSEKARAMRRYRESLGEALPTAQRVGKCSFCRHRTPKFKVQRLRPTEAGFEVIEMPYCGEC